MSNSLVHEAKTHGREEVVEKGNKDVESQVSNEQEEEQN